MRGSSALSDEGIYNAELAASMKHSIAQCRAPVVTTHHQGKNIVSSKLSKYTHLHLPDYIMSFRKHDHTTLKPPSLCGAMLSVLPVTPYIM